MSDAASQIKARLMSYLFGACQPDRGNVFGWFDDHADEALEFALRDHLAANRKMRAALERIADPRNIHFAGDAQVVARSALSTKED